jgi:hypothetical protein
MGKGLNAPRSYHQAEKIRGQPLKSSMNLSYHPRPKERTSVKNMVGQARSDLGSTPLSRRVNHCLNQVEGGCLFVMCMLSQMLMFVAQTRTFAHVLCQMCVKSSKSNLLCNSLYL